MRPFSLRAGEALLVMEYYSNASIFGFYIRASERTQAFEMGQPLSSALRPLFYRASDAFHAQIYSEEEKKNQ